MEFRELDLASRIDQYVSYRDELRQEERLEKYGEDRDSFFVSEAGKCARQIAYSFYKLPRSPLDGRTLRLLENGNRLQDRYSDYFKDLGVWVGEEIPVSTDEQDDVPFLLRGKLDILINYAKLFDPNYDKEEPDLEDLAIIEMKSINTWGFKVLERDMAPNLDHLFQITIYMWLTGIHKGWIVYEDKNDQTLLTFPIEYDERLIYGTEDGRSKGIIHGFMDIARNLEEGSVPPRCPEADKHKFPCKWKSGHCDYYFHCWDPDHQGEIIPKNSIEFGGKTFDLDNLPEGFTKDDVLKAKELWEMMNPPTEEAELKPEEAELKPEKAELKPEKAELKPEEADLTATAPEFITENGEKAIYCLNCGMEVTYKRLGNGGTIACKHCNHRNSVSRED